ncbi:hypothetical protein [Nocardia terpenica]|uniref:hypothetical protein n=1 Tax=Nocardia terpenica TaxID=455432 RepID=UPI0012E6F15F|nr:hypothetical protein [Nocardia terpenica]NQE92555.1 hypothetical protein [Nocardia terpenica]
MSRIPRVRLGGSGLVVLVAILFAGSMMDCALADTGVDAPAVVITDPGRPAGVADVPGQAPDGCCGPCTPRIPCITAPVASGVGLAVSPPLAPPVLLLAPVTLGCGAAPTAGVRGPPAVPVSGGRDVLTRICIARR